MPRKRNLIVVESDAALQKLAKSASPQVASRIAALRLLKQDADLTIREAAEIVGCGERSLHRWIAVYQSYGVGAFLAEPLRTEKITAEIADDVRQQLSKNEFNAPAEVHEYLRDVRGISCSLSSVNALLKRLSVKRSLAVERPARGATVQSTVDTGAEWLRSFVETLPPLLSCTEWIERFRVALSNYLQEVDRISVDLNVRCLNNTIAAIAPNALLTRNIHNSARDRARVAFSSMPKPTAFGNRLLQQMHDGGFRFDRYHEPHVEEYHLDKGVYLGAIILWRSADKPPLLVESIDRLRSLAVTIRFLMSDCAARHQSTQPATQDFYEILNELVQTARLTKKQGYVLSLRLLGYSYKEVADALGISVQTVGRHLTTIHQKTGTQSLSELWAKYFAPRSS
jgi:DNA-binding CsgD family transcriptional regulator